MLGSRIRIQDPYLFVHFDPFRSGRTVGCMGKGMVFDGGITCYTVTEITADDCISVTTVSPLLK